MNIDGRVPLPAVDEYSPQTGHPWDTPEPDLVVAKERNTHIDLDAPLVATGVRAEGIALAQAGTATQVTYMGCANVFCEPDQTGGNMAASTTHNDATQLSLVDTAFVTDYVPEVGMPFEIPGGCCQQTNEVVAMEDAWKNNNPTLIYEFCQGLTDYGENPKIVIIYANGAEMPFNGISVDEPNDNPIVAVEFRNGGGKGMRPEDLVNWEHRDDGAKTFGEHGRGTTTALTFAAMLGMRAKATSYYNGFQWEAETSLKRAPARATPVLHATGQFTASSNGDTIFRLERPTSKFLKMLGKISQHFLYANPHFPGAVVVPPTPEAMAKGMPQRICIETGEVMCVDGFVDHGDDGSCDFIFVGGRRVSTGGVYSILPWAIRGFEKASANLRIGRSQDSNGFNGEGLNTILGRAIRQLKDIHLLRRLIAAQFKNRYYSREFCDYQQNRVGPFSLDTAVMVRHIWEHNFDGALIDYSDARIEVAKRKNPDKEIRRVPESLYYFLEDAGVTTLQKEFGVLDAREVDGLGQLIVPNADAPDNFETLARQVAAETGMAPDFIVVGGEKFLRIEFPLVEGVDAWNGKTTSQAGRILRTAAIMAAASGMEYQVASVKNDGKLDEVFITVIRASRCDPKPTYSTTVRLAGTDMAQCPKFAGFQPERTYFLLSAGQAFDGEQGIDAANKLTRLQRFRTAIMRCRQQFSAVVSRISLRRDPLAYLPPEVLESEASIGQVSEGTRPSRPIDLAMEHLDTRLSPGYYRTGANTDFALDAVSGRAYWRSKNNWQKTTVTNGVPKNLSADAVKIVLPEVAKFAALGVKERHHIVGYEVSPKDAKVAFFRDSRTNIWMITGTFDQCIYYTDTEDAESRTRFASVQPINGESENLIDPNLLVGNRKAGVCELRALSNDNVIINLAAVMGMFQYWFSYNQNPELHSQVRGNSLREIVAKIINTSSGICNISGTEFALLLRAAKLPSRYLNGYYVGEDGSVGTHAYVEYWDGYTWVTTEPLIGTSVKNSDQLRASYSIPLRSEDSLAGPPQKRSTFTGARVAFAAAVFAALGALAILRNNSTPQEPELPDTATGKIVALRGDGLEDTQNSGIFTQIGARAKAAVCEEVCE